MKKTGNVTVITSYAAIKNIAFLWPKRVGLAAAVLGVLAGCASSPMPVYRPAPAIPSAPSTQTAPTAPAAPARAPGAATAPRAALPPVATWQQYRLRAAHIITQANPAHSFTGPLPDPLHGIPVLQIMLNADGSVRLIDTLRVSKVAPETTQLAISAIRRAGSFGPVGHLPQPWQFNETFLYNEALKFQLRSLVEGE